MPFESPLNDAARNNPLPVISRNSTSAWNLATTQVAFPAQMCLAQDIDVVHTFTPDRSDQPFDKTILPG